VPVYRGERDNVVGVLYTKDLLGRDVTARGFRVEPLLRPPTFVPVGTRTGDAFRELRRRRVHVALVVDEYGGIAGLVTMEDLLEELFGEIGDEYDEAEAT
jgi:putative hemolysin